MEKSTQTENSNASISHRKKALETARRALAILEKQAAGYTSLTIPAKLQIELEDKHKEVAQLENELSSAIQPPKVSKPKQPQPVTSKKEDPKNKILLVLLFSVLFAIIAYVFLKNFYSLESLQNKRLAYFLQQGSGFVVILEISLIMLFLYPAITLLSRILKTTPINLEDADESIKEASKDKLFINIARTLYSAIKSLDPGEVTLSNFALVAMLAVAPVTAASIYEGWFQLRPPPEVNFQVRRSTDTAYRTILPDTSVNLQPGETLDVEALLPPYLQNVTCKWSVAARDSTVSTRANCVTAYQTSKKEGMDRVTVEVHQADKLLAMVSFNISIQSNTP